MKKLFCVKNSKGKRTSGYFDNKQQAKQERDLLNGVEGKKEEYHVALGPDHIGPHGHGNVPYMRRQPKK